MGSLLIYMFLMTKKTTNADFLKRSIVKHNNKYTYPEEFIDYDCDIVVMCPVHGKFKVNSGRHMNGQGCIKCSKCYRRTQSEFVDSANLIHNFKYTYPEKFVSVSKKIVIECPIHGNFTQLVSDHLKGFGCEKCSKTFKKTHEDFIKNAKLIHGDKYDYSLIKYVDVCTKVEIVCKEHGSFYITPNKHINCKNGCAKCSKNHRLSFEEILDKFKNVHGDRYDYSLSIDNYKNTYTPIKIICSEHGIFLQRPAKHMSGGNCHKCVGNNIKSLHEAVNKFKEIHFNRYSYDTLISLGDRFIKGSEKVLVACKKHGDFLVNVRDHIDGVGCNKCNTSKGEISIENYLIRNKIEYKTQYKFEDCKNINMLSFDFAIFRNENILCLVEFQGEQHYHPVNFKSQTVESAKLKYEQITLRDKIKAEYCEKNNIPLLAICYKNLKSVDQIMEDFLKRF